MNTHKDFCDWMVRNRASLSPEAWEAGCVAARWLDLMESGVAMPDVAERAAPAIKKFRELIGR